MMLRETYNSLIAAGDLKPDPAQRALIPKLDAIREGLQAPQELKLLERIFKRPPPPVKGLYMWGGVGRGKSMLMDLLYHAVEQPKARYHFHAFMQKVHRDMTAARRQGVDDAIAPVATALAKDLRFLAFDEMQITDITDAMLVGRLFEALFEAGVTIVTTSNRPPIDLYKDGLNRQLFLPFIDLIESKMTIHEIVSQSDYRQGLLNGAQSYFSPLSPQSTTQFDALWNDFATDTCAPLELTVQKRTVRLPLFCNGVGRASFDDLCARPLGAADYLELSQFVRVLFLSDIPQLSQDNFNEAKRFVTLIDTLYEAKIQLICTAEADPEHLYRSGRGQFEFERTASRLREMQSLDWNKQTQTP